MIAEALVLVYGRRFCRSSDFRACDLVIDAPASVLGPGLPPVAPPCVGLAGGVGVKTAIANNPAYFIEDTGQPCALFGQAATGFKFSLPVFPVDFLVGDVPVATKPDFHA